MSYHVLDKYDNDHMHGGKFTFATHEEAQACIDNLIRHGAETFGPFRIVEGVSSKKGIEVD